MLCCEPTAGCVSCQVDCERAVVSYHQPPWWMALVFLVLCNWIGLLFGLLLALVLRREEPKESGKDRSFTLPLRLCDECRPTLTNVEAVKRTLRSVPLYRRLLDKYPRAVISLLDQPTVPPL